jgi:hypothetical protein
VFTLSIITNNNNIVSSGKKILLPFRSDCQNRKNKQLANKTARKPDDIDTNKDFPHSRSIDEETDDNTHESRQWTIMAYLCGNGDLEQESEQKLADLEKVGSDDTIAFVAQIGRMSKLSENERLYINNPSGSSGKGSTVVEELGKTNMASPETLTDFITWGMEKYPAENYAVVLFGHGAGFEGAMHDDLFYDSLEINELEKALNDAAEQSGKKIDVFGMNSCLMSGAETVYASKDAVKYFLSSQEVAEAGNWNYEKMAEGLKRETNGDGLTTDEAFEIMIESHDENTLMTASVIDCSKIDDLAEKMGAFAEKLVNTDTDKKIIQETFRKAQSYSTPQYAPKDQLRDIVSLTECINKNNEIDDEELKKTARSLGDFVKDEVVILNKFREGIGLDDSHGLSVYAPADEADFHLFGYKKISFVKDTGWDKVIKKYGTDSGGFISGIY